MTGFCDAGYWMQNVWMHNETVEKASSILRVGLPLLWRGRGV